MSVKSRFALFMLVIACATAHAEMTQGPAITIYSPNLLNQVIQDAGKLSLHNLPPGSGTVILAFAHLLGMVAVWKSLNTAWAASSTSGHMQKDGSWGGVLLMFIAGVCVFHIDKTMGMLSATFPGFPDLTDVLTY